MSFSRDVAALVEALVDPTKGASLAGPLAQSLAGAARERSLERGEVLCREGDAADTFWIVTSGRLRVRAGGDEGAPITVDAVHVGALVGESALLRGKEARRNATLVAAEPTRLLEFPIDDQRLDALAQAGLRDSLLGLERLRATRRRQGVRRRLCPPHQWRSLLFLPQFAFEKAYQIPADCFIVDFQDAVPLDAKPVVRAGLVRGLANGEFDGRPVVVRINESALPEQLAADLDVVVGLEGVSALMPTMIERPEELGLLDAELSRREAALGLPDGHTRLLVLFETPSALLRAADLAIAGGGRLLGVMLGHGDLFRLTGAEPQGETTMDWPRNQTVFAARAAGIAAFDTPYTDLRDAAGLEHEATLARRHGFDGKCCVHPSQVSTVDRCLRPPPARIAWARRVEAARRDGRLATLSGKLAGAAASSDDAPSGQRRETDGMAIVDGQLVGPPHIKAAQRLLRTTEDTPGDPWPGAVKGRVVRHTLPAAARVLDELPNPYELTITPGMRDLWQQCYYGHDPAATSAPLARTLGLSPGDVMPVPFMLGLYLCVSMSSTHGAIYHLGFRDAVQLRPIGVGDTVRQRITLLRVRNTSDGKRAVVTTRRSLVRVPDDVELFRVDKLELYAAQPRDLGDAPGAPDLLPEMSPAALPAPGFGARVREALKQRAHWADAGRPTERFEIGEVLLHTFARPLGVSANLALSTLFLVTHPIHLDHHRFDRGDARGIVVSGGLVIAATLAAVSRDVTHVVAQELLWANNLRPVSPNQTIGAMSRIVAVAPDPENAEIEVLLIRTLGVRDLTPGHELTEAVLPIELFEPVQRSAESLDALCRHAEVPELEGRIVSELVWRAMRLRPVVPGSVPADALDRPTH